MKNEEYIESGQIEMCMVGAAEKDEAAELECLRQSNEDIDAEAVKIETALEDLALAHRLTPNPWVKHRLFGGINWPGRFSF